MLRRQRATTHEDIIEDEMRISVINVFTIFPRGQMNLTNWMNIHGDTWIHKGSKTIMRIFVEEHYVTMRMTRKPSVAALRAMIAEIKYRARLRRITTMIWALMCSPLPREIIRIAIPYV